MERGEPGPTYGRVVPGRMRDCCVIRHEWRMAPCDQGTSVPRGDVDRRGRDRAAVIGGGEDGDVADVGERGPAAEDRLRRDVVDDPSEAAVEIGGEGVHDSTRLQRDDADPVGAELGRQLAARTPRPPPSPTWKPPRKKSRSGAPDPPNERITPERWRIMCRAAARAVMNAERSSVVTGCSKSASDISASGVKNTSPALITQSDTSRLPKRSTSVSAWASTAPSSRASTTAVSASPPASRIDAATASSLSSVRPTRWTRAPSRAKARATAPPIGPPAP